MRKLKKLSRKNSIIILAVTSVIIIVLWWLLATFKTSTEPISATNEPLIADNSQAEDEENKNTEDTEAEKEINGDPEISPDPETATPQWPVTYTQEQANSLTVVVNKKHRLPSNYVPSLVTVSGGQIRPEASADLQRLLDDASSAGAPMNIISSYRSYQTQVSTYQYWVDTQGQAQADRESARPGHSEHQTGLTVDMGNPDGSCRLVACFGDGAAGKWLAKNAHKYGFIVRYPPNSESLTGYIYEPWHIRYLGVDTATAVYTSGLTLDQYYGVEAGGY